MPQNGTWRDRARGAGRTLCIGMLLAIGLVMIPDAVWAASLGSDALQGVKPTLDPTIPVTPVPQVSPSVRTAPAPQPPETRFECPKIRSVNCMPPVQGPTRPLCTKEYIDWVKANCPGVEIVH